MRIAITSTGNSMDSTIDPRFGRCSFFAIYDTVRQTTEFIVNPGKNAKEGAGPAAVQFVADYRISKIVSGEFGVKIKPLLDKLNIEMITHKECGKTIADVITFYKF